MDGKENKGYGKVIDYDPQWSGPLKIARETTDFGFLVSWALYFAVWIGVGVYAFSTGEIKSSKSGTATSHLDNDGIIISSSTNSAMSIALGFVALAAFLCYAFLLLLRHFPKTVVFTSIFVHCVLLSVIICISIYQLVKKTEGTSAAYILVIAIIVLTVTILFLIAFRKKVVVACGVVEESTRAITCFPSSFLFPILPITMYAISIAFARCTYLYLSANPSMQSQNTPVYIYLFHGINFFGLVWMSSFTYAFTQMVLSATFATWYWTMDKNRVPSHTIFKGLHITSRFHLGTLAFGSLIIAAVQVIKTLAKAVPRPVISRLHYSNDNNNCGCALVCCLAAVCAAVADALRYISGNAYIVCTNHGTNFIQSAKDAFNLLMRNALDVVAVTHVTNAILLLGQLVVVGLSVLATYAYCRNMEDNIMYSAVTLVSVSTVVISTLVFEIIKTAINTIFLCVLEDYERNDGSSERPYFMTDRLRQLLLEDQ